jgi:ribokinase
MISGKPSDGILCMGSINMDLVMYAENLPGPGETVVTDNFSTFPGGKGGNQAATIGRLGGNPVFLGKLGSDEFSASLRASLTEKGVDVSHIIECNGTAGIAIILVDKQGQNSICFTPGANALLTVEEIHQKMELFQPGRVLLATFEIGVDLVYEAAKLAKSRGMFVVVDPAPMVDLPNDFHEYVDVITPNETEASLLTGVSVSGISSAKQALRQMIDRGFRLPIITLGDNGLIFVDKGIAQHVPALEVEAIDTTAAGDVFAGALTFSLAHGVTLLEAIKFANIAAGLSTTVKGAQTSIPSLELVMSRMKT